MFLCATCNTLSQCDDSAGPLLYELNKTIKNMVGLFLVFLKRGLCTMSSGTDQGCGKEGTPPITTVLEPPARGVP